MGEPRTPGKVREIPGFKILLVRPEALPHLRRDSALWPRVLNKDEIPTYSVETFMQKVDVFLTGWERLIVEATQKPITRTRLVIIQSDTPHFILDLLASIKPAVGHEKKRWWRFWK